MTRKEFEKICSDFIKDRIRLKEIKSGDTVYTTDCWMDFFECVVMSVNVDEGNITVEDLSLKNIYKNQEQRIKTLEAFYTVKEAKEYWNTTEYKYKPF